MSTGKRFLSLKVLERFMSPEELAEFMTKYNGSLHKMHASKPVSDQDKLILADYQGGMRTSELCKKYSLSTNGVSSAVMRAVRG